MLFLKFKQKKLNPKRIKLEKAYKNKETTALKIEFWVQSSNHSDSIIPLHRIEYFWETYDSKT